MLLTGVMFLFSKRRGQELFDVHRQIKKVASHSNLTQKVGIVVFFFFRHRELN